MNKYFKSVKISEELPDVDVNVFCYHDTDNWQSECYRNSDNKFYNTWETDTSPCECYPTHWLKEVTEIPDTEAVRTAVADYMDSEGCSCCRDDHSHKIHEKKLAELLNVPAYKDDSGFDFSQFKTTE